MSTARDELNQRTIPFMTLSSGDATSKTAAPSPIANNITAAERVIHRFRVSGNAIVTGGFGTLGLVASRALLEHGLAGLAIFDVSTKHDMLERLKSDFPEASIVAYDVDITSSPAVEKAVSAAATALGPISHLLGFAGIVDCAHAVDTSPLTFRRVIDVNTTGSFIVAQTVARQMMTAGVRGSIMFTASISGHRVNYPQPQVAYNVSKAAVAAMVKSLAAEWAHAGIRVNSISPGYMDTILNEGDGLKEARDIWAARNPMGRMGQPEELTGAVVLLTSNAGSYINGADIVIDGGQILF